MGEARPVSALVLAIVSDPRPRETIMRHLRKEGMPGIGAASMGEGVVQARRAGPALVLLDRALVVGHTASLCRGLRSEGAPLLLLLAAGGSSAEAVAALEAGVDDYLMLPCSMAELMARIVSLLRRRGDRSAPVAEEIRLGDLSIHFPLRQVTLSGQPIDLAPKEFEILAAPAERAGRVVAREELIRQVWGAGRAVKRQTLDVYFFSLRAKIEANPERPIRLLTVRGVGYRLVAPESAPEAGRRACGV